MGDLESRQIAAAAPLYIKEISDGVALKTVEANYLERKKCIKFNQGGRGFESRHRYQRGTPQGFLGSEGTNFVMRNDFLVPAWTYRGLVDGIAMSYQEKQECKGEAAQFDLAKTLASNLDADLRDAFCTDFYLSGTTRNAKTIQGLAAAIGAAGTYAGLSQSTYPSWASQHVAGTGFTQAPLEILLNLIMSCAVGAKGQTGRADLDMIFCSATEWRTVMNNIQVQQRFLQDAELVKAGFTQNLLVHGVPMTWSNYCPTGTIYGLNSDHIELRCTTDAIFDAEQEKSIGLPIVWLFYAVSHMNIRIDNPRTMGDIHTIT